MSNWRNYHTNISFIDLLFNTILGFAVFFAISFALMNQKSINEANITTKAEFIVTLTWDKESSDDVDLWIEDPMGTTLFFRNRDVGLMHLDRDDLGNTNDEIVTIDGKRISVQINQEIGTIRGFIPGEWVVNVHMYSKRTSKETNVEVKIEKLNPRVEIIAFKKLVMTEKNEEVTISRFVMSEGGSILDINNIQKPLAGKILKYI